MSSRWQFREFPAWRYGLTGDGLLYFRYGRRRISWQHAQRRRCYIHWKRAGMPIANHILDATPYRMAFEFWRVRLRMKQRRKASGTV